MGRLILSTNILAINIITLEAGGREYLPSVHRTLGSISSNTHKYQFLCRIRINRARLTNQESKEAWPLRALDPSQLKMSLWKQTPSGFLKQITGTVGYSKVKFCCELLRGPDLPGLHEESTGLQTKKYISGWLKRQRYIYSKKQCALYKYTEEKQFFSQM